MLLRLEIVTACYLLFLDMFGTELASKNYKSEDLPVSSRPIQRRVTAVNQQASTGVIEGRNVIMT